MNGSILSSGYTGVERRRNGPAPYFGKERRTSLMNRIALQDETFLVERARTGDREAFAQLFDRYADMIFKYVYFNVGSRPESEQLTARVFLTASRELNRHNATPSFGAWLFRVARQVIVEHDHASAGAKTIPFAEHDASRPSRRLENALFQLANDERQVLVLRLLVGHNTEQIAQILGKRPSAVKTLQHRALDGLSEILRKGAER